MTTLAPTRLRADIADARRRRRCARRGRLADHERPHRAHRLPREPRRRRVRLSTRSRAGRRGAGRPGHAGERRSRAVDVRVHAAASSASGRTPTLTSTTTSSWSATAATCRASGPVLPRHAELFGRVPIVNIDHHVSNPGFGAVDWIDATAAATCEMDTLLMPALGAADNRCGRRHRREPDCGRGDRHGELPASERDVTDACAWLPSWSRPARRSRSRRGSCIGPSRTGSCCSSAACWVEWSRRSMAGWSGRPSCDEDFAATGTSAEDAEGLSDLLEPVGRGRAGDPLPPERLANEDQRSDARRRAGRHDADHGVRRRRPCASGGRDAASSRSSKAVPLVLDAARRMFEADGG